MSGIEMTRLVRGLAIFTVLAGGVLWASPIQGTAEDLGPVPSHRGQSRLGGAGAAQSPLHP